MAKEKILAMDDEEDLLELVSCNSRNYGYTVETMTSGEDALERLRVFMPDLILLDLMLPGIDGLKGEVEISLEQGLDSQLSNILSLLMAAQFQLKAFRAQEVHSLLHHPMYKCPAFPRPNIILTFPSYSVNIIMLYYTSKNKYACKL